MTGLQETFYIMAIIFMSLMFLFMIVILAAILVIRSKVVKIHRAIDEKMDRLSQLAEKGGELAGAAVVKRARKAFKKTKG
jgi:cell division protein FtsL